MSHALLDNIDIILVGTLQSGNLGSVARVMKNMGIPGLSLVRPQCAIDDQARWMATHGDDILASAQTFETIRNALSPSAYIYGTTARTRKTRAQLTPRRMAAEAVKKLQHNRIAVVFGPEDCGLSNSELQLCDEVVAIPTVENHASINISHAAMIICYELFCAAGNPASEFRTEQSLAPSAQTEAMYDHMRSTLLEIGFLNTQNPDYFLGKLRRILTRAGLSTGEVRFLRGIFRQLAWYIRTTGKRRG